MRFRTEFLTRPSDIQLLTSRKILMLGSCFTDNIGRWLRDSCWDVAHNPCGTLFNPASVANVMLLACNESLPEITEADGRYFSWDFPTAFSDMTSEGAKRKISGALAVTRSYILDSQAIILTLGTSRVYTLTDGGKIVANCHKMSSRLFADRMLSVEESVGMVRKAIEAARTLNPALRVILTVSPVRYLSEGFAANSRSKSRLLLTCENLVSDLPDVDYFPAYEILTDDLRDYRFYADDLIHPSGKATEYIAEAFLSTYLSAAERDVLRGARKLKMRLAHRPIMTDDTSRKEFLEETRRLAGEFDARHPGLVGLSPSHSEAFPPE